MNAIAAEFGPIDVLVNDPGSEYASSLMDTLLENWQRLLDLNVTSLLQCIQGILPVMPQKQSGTIINVVCVAGKQVFASWGAYCACKLGLQAVSRTLAVEECAEGIRLGDLSGIGECLLLGQRNCKEGFFARAI